MKNQTKYRMENIDSGVVPIVLTLNDLLPKVKKTSASEPIFIDHL